VSPFKLYIVLSSKLSNGLKIAQACHALRQFVGEYPHIDAYWFRESNNIVCLEVDDLPSLADRLEEVGLRISRFCEPDLNNELTAIAVEPKGWKRLSNVALAR
jgi:hypothetical protein